MNKLLHIMKRVIVPTLIVAALVSLFIWREHQSFKNADLQQAEFNATEITNLISNKIKIATMALESTRSLFLSSEFVSAEEYNEFLSQLFARLPELSLVQYVDKNNIGSYIYPLEGDNLRRIGLDYNENTDLLPLIEKAAQTRLAVASQPRPLTQGYPGLYLVLPIYKDSQFAGYVLGQIRLPEITSMASALADRIGMKTIIQVNNRVLPLRMDAIYTNVGERLVYPSQKVLDNTAPNPYNETWSIQRRFFMADSEWYIIAQPPPHILIQKHGFSILLGVFLLMVTFLLLAILDRELRRQQEISARGKDFLSLVSHQLRLPLTQLNWSSEMLMERTDLPEEARELINENHTISTGASKLVVDLLNISRIDRGVLKVNKENVNLEELMEEILLTLKQFAADSKVKLSIASIPKLQVSIDRQKAIESIRNIIDNAIKYGKEGKIVQINTEEKKEGFITINIQDYGPGINQEDGIDIFDKATAFTKKEVGSGAGLGLYLTKQFIELMGGSVNFESTPGNTTFMVDLPLTK